MIEDERTRLMGDVDAEVGTLRCHNVWFSSFSPSKCDLVPFAVSELENEQ